MGAMAAGKAAGLMGDSGARGFGGLVPMALAAQQRNAAKKTKAPGMAGATIPQPVMK